MADGSNKAPAAPAPVPAARVGGEFDERLEDLWYIKLPGLMAPVGPQVAEATADGAWTAAWKYVGALAPPAALLVGFLAPRVLPITYVYTESLLFLVLVTVGALLSGSVGVGLLAGYILGDLTGGTESPFCTSFGVDLFSCPIRRFGGQVVSYMLLALPAITLPLLGRTLAGEIKLGSVGDPMLRKVGLAAVFAAIAGVLIYLWCQAMVVLIRPIFTWVGGSPTFEAISPVQNSWETLAFVAALAAAGRVALERALAPRAPRERRATDLQRRRQTGESVGGVWDKTPDWVRVAFTTTLVTLVLSGTYEGWFDALLVALVTGLISAWRNNLIKMIPGPIRWARMVRRVPTIARFVAAPAIGYFLANIILSIVWERISSSPAAPGLRPLMLGALLTLMVFYLLFPILPGEVRRPARLEPPRQPTEATPASPAAEGRGTT